MQKNPKDLRKYLSQVKYCHEREMKSGTEINGDLLVAITVTGGTVIDVAVPSNNTGSEQLAACVVRKIKRWKFPVSCPANIEVNYSFTIVQRQ